MKRKLFFWLEKLKISRNERYTVFTLMIIVCALVLINAVLIRKSPLHEKQYAAIDRRFKARTAHIKRQHRQLMARYQPQKSKPAAIDTARKDTVRKKKHAPKVKSPANTLINVNTADEKTLQQLKGIGPAYARRIVAYRQKNGHFKTKDELIKIKGIGKKRLANIKPFIKLVVQQ